MFGAISLNSELIWLSSGLNSGLICIDSATRNMNTIRISIYIDGTTRTSTKTQHQPEQRLIKVSFVNK